ncbi:hypothetical protein EVAR_32461_1 [Eumeta japonica]|uniref:Uncharacterized protein n=1 Tax=Eumeta variegata TaxID=151549 RepID=A0A4C1VME3_EUMVA|nr:hypothetical protein EVAR_32461_1 [Eumeta japonica]
MHYSSTARGRPIIVEWERDADSAGLSLVRPLLDHGTYGDTCIGDGSLAGPGALMGPLGRPVFAVSTRSPVREAGTPSRRSRTLSSLSDCEHAQSLQHRTHAPQCGD